MSAASRDGKNLWWGNAKGITDLLENYAFFTWVAWIHQTNKANSEKE